MLKNIGLHSVRLGNGCDACCCHGCDKCCELGMKVDSNITYCIPVIADKKIESYTDKDGVSHRAIRTVQELQAQGHNDFYEMKLAMVDIARQAAMQCDKYNKTR